MATGSVSPKTGKILDIPGATVTIGTATDSALGGTVSVPFTAANTTFGGPVYKYTATSSPGGITATATATPITVIGLTDNTSYTFTVAATNPSGSNAASAASNSVAPTSPPGSFYSIATSSPSAVASVTFSSIPTTYKSLQVRYNLIMPGTQTMTVQLNNDTAANYASHGMSGNGSLINITAAANTSGMGLVQYGRTRATYPNVGIFDLEDYASTTKLKTGRSVFGTDDNGTAAYPTIETLSSLYFNTPAAITSLTVLCNTGTFTGTIALYGIN